MNKIRRNAFLVFILMTRIDRGAAQTIPPDSKFEIKGNVSQICREGKVVLMYAADGWKSDTVTIGKGLFTIRGLIKDPVRATINLVRPGKKEIYLYTSFYLAPGSITVSATKDSAQTLVITGGQVQQEWSVLNKAEQPYNDRLAASNKAAHDRYDAAIHSGDSAKVAEVKKYPYPVMSNEEYADYKLAMTAIVEQEDSFIIRHPESYVSWDIVRGRAEAEKDPDRTEKFFSLLDGKYRNSASGKALLEKIGLAQKLSVGHPALDFTQPDTLGRLVSLSSFRGKYVLLDFWASWCGPCRQENPNVAKAFEKYKNKGFTVLSVSLDRPGQKDKWLEAIRHDNMPWEHVSDLLYWNNAVAKAYGILSIPRNFLIGPDGIILAKDLRGGALTARLSKIFN